MELSEGFETTGAVILDQAKIRGLCDLKGSKLVSAALASKEAAAQAKATPEGAPAESPAVSPTISGVEGRYDEIVLSLVDATIESLEMPTVALERPRGVVDLSRARVGSYLDFAAAWPPEPGFRGWSKDGREIDHLVLDGFLYQHLANPSGAVLGASKTQTFEGVGERRIGWLEGQDLAAIRDHFKPQAWVQLANRLAAQGYDADARTVTIAKLRSEARAQSTTRGQKWQARILDLFALYGFNPWRTVMWMAVLIVAFAGVWTWAASHCSQSGCLDEDVFVVSNRDAYTPDKFAATYPAFNALGYSFDVFVPFISFGYEDHWRPNVSWRPFAEIALPVPDGRVGSPNQDANGARRTLTLTLGGVLYVLMVLEMLLGLILTSLAVTGFTGLLRTDETKL